LEARLVDVEPFGRCVVGRGAINSKGPLVAFLNALESILAVGEEIPVNLKFVAQGDEELESTYFAEFVMKHKEMLEADALFGPDACQDEKGKVIMGLGWKGVEYIELECSGKSWGRGPMEFDIHSSDKSWIDSPAWRLVHALASMTSEDGNKILVEDWYDNVRSPSEEDLQLVDKLEKTFDEETVRRETRANRFINDLHGRNLLLQYMYSSTLNIDGIWGGYIGPGSKTVLPHKATVKMDARLVPDQTSGEVIQKIRRHLDKLGYTDIKIRSLDPYEWAKTSVHEPIVQAAIQAYQRLGHAPEIWPITASSVPYYLFNRGPLHLPFIDAGLGHGERAHSPDEYFVIDGNDRVEGLAGCEKSFAVILDTYAKYSAQLHH
jgi:acetylornithine deacetylase/succinyl-diaminopimelate desuccinylase-like protein